MKYLILQQVEKGKWDKVQGNDTHEPYVRILLDHPFIKALSVEIHDIMTNIVRLQ